MVWFFLLFFPFSHMQGEGTKEFYASNCNNLGSIQIWDNGDTNRKFATYNAPEEYRLYIRANYQDHIYLGFGFNTSNSSYNQGDVWFRVKDPNGNIILGPKRIQSTMGTGWISSCSRAMAGPASIVGSAGYTDIKFIAAMDGDYYIEFAEDNDASKRAKRVIQWFDVSVYEGGFPSNYRPGRLWSKQWDINLMSSTNRFHADMYAFSNDSVVTKFKFNGIQPYGFTISCNSFGSSNLGTLNERRVSRYRNDILQEGGTPSVPEYPIFINPPDINEFPTGVFGNIDSFALYSCTDTVNCISVYTNKSGQVEMIMGFSNGSQRNMIDSVGSGGNCFEWDGLDGYGNQVAPGDTVAITLQYATGITHLPLMDVEFHTNGFTVDIVRPTTKPNGDIILAPALFWDDSQLTDPENSLDGVSNLEGAGDGSHRWQNRGANNSNPEVINTWWYTAVEENTYVVTCPALLPITLENFQGEVVGKDLVLQWSTLLEDMLDKYTIERSLDGKAFRSIGELSANNMPSKYSFTDNHVPPTDGIIYYRLKIHNFSGDIEYSDIIGIKVRGLVDTRLSYDVSFKQFTLHAGQLMDYRYRFMDITGHVLQEGMSSTNLSEHMPVHSAGMYFLAVQIDETMPWNIYKISIP